MWLLCLIAKVPLVCPLQYWNILRRIFRTALAVVAQVSALPIPVALRSLYTSESSVLGLRFLLY